MTPIIFLIRSACYLCQISLLGLLLSSCGGESSDRQKSQIQRVADPIDVVQGKASVQSPPQTQSIEKSAPLMPQNEVNAETSTTAAQIERLRKIPHLQSLSEQQLLMLLNELPKRSREKRMALLHIYPTLAQLPLQQKELLLEQLAQIVPITS